MEKIFSKYNNMFHECISQCLQYDTTAECVTHLKKEKRLVQFFEQAVQKPEWETDSNFKCLVDAAKDKLKLLRVNEKLSKHDLKIFRAFKKVYKMKRTVKAADALIQTANQQTETAKKRVEAAEKRAADAENRANQAQQQADAAGNQADAALSEAEKARRQVHRLVQTVDAGVTLPNRLRN